MEKDPRSQNSDRSVLGPWIAWIVACTLLPVLPFLLGMIWIVFALLAQCVCSIYLAVAMTRKLRMDAWDAVLMSMALMVASLIVGFISFLVGDSALGGAGLGGLGLPV